MPSLNEIRLDMKPQSRWTAANSVRSIDDRWRCLRQSRIAWCTHGCDSQFFCRSRGDRCARATTSLHHLVPCGRDLSSILPQAQALLCPFPRNVSPARSLVNGTGRKRQPCQDFFFARIFPLLWCLSVSADPNFSILEHEKVSTPTSLIMSPVFVLQ